MKAKYVDLPYEKLPHDLNNPSAWEASRRQGIEIDPHPLHPADMEALSGKCSGPYFDVLGGHIGMDIGGRPTYPCICIIELDESALDDEVTAIYEELHT